MEIGDYLYIIVLVIAIVTSMIGKAKKKEKEADKTPPLAPNWEDIAQELKKTVPQPTNDTPQPTPQPIKPTTPPIAEKQFKFENTDSKITKETPHQTHNYTIQENETAIDPQNLDELKKAVIYSEILNRKY
ncbi:MAG TPA: hypothetical protein PK984_02720 [Paludibacteraceae bacterium]|nr:hypothetical protein [Paludibacteraceae bacterium]HOO23614.1 hypothetical protein [Paludibacteraceae bacterium]HOS37112.1 hypothetical protein [Paludibacteraceae bacterium]HPD27563.1 hypothetical protein [Paludibacteraceae bacterium]HPK20017.1 hypothetical protein [Paludibacteraceae bacterium]